jgi:uncharacterized protein
MHQDNAVDSLADLIAHAAHLLPVQGPIGVFIHHNTLHAFQHLPFEQAVRQASELFQAEPYMREEQYRQAMRAGRIHLADLDRVIEHEGRDVELRRVMLVPGLRDFRPETIRWHLDEAGMLAEPGAREGFRFWFEQAESSPIASAAVRRPGEDLDDVVHPLLIRLTAAFLDQGLAYWPMPNRDEGFWRTAILLLRQPGLAGDRLRRLPAWVKTWESLTAEQAVDAAMTVFGVEDRGAFLEAQLLALPGWAGLVRQLENDPTLAPHEAVPARLVDFLAVRLLLTVAAVDSAGAGLQAWKAPVATARDDESGRLAEAARWWDAARLMKFDHTHQTLGEVDRFRAAVDAFDEFERRRLWHAAYEWRHARQILLPLREYAAKPSGTAPARLAAQVFFCIDEREESIRRHLEEIDPEIETFGAAGFFGVAMNYQGLDDAHGVALCPVVVKPAHAVTEKPVDGHEEHHGRRQALRRVWSRLAHGSFVSSRTLVRGWVGTTVLGVFSLVPLAARVLSPRRYAKVLAWLNASVLPEPRTELQFMRDDGPGHPSIDGLMAGFTLNEQADRVASVLAPAGLRKGMAKLVVVLGHGSTCLNNPHESAYECGACGGRRGGPNARIFAAMANHPGVRAALRERGVHIPGDTWFVGGCHDTGSDDIDLYDLEEVPSSLLNDLSRVRASLDAARAANALERSRRFEAAQWSDDPVYGLHHVQERTEHLAEPRPECGHGTNAVCIVGRRDLTRGLFLDRRAFLVSYDATQDATNANLARLLGAVIPVCGGISLEYYFSFVDNERYGCGTKLPHNVTGLVGVMNGYEGDLRTGLPWQMVEIHEPVRILFVVETTPDRVLATIQANPQLAEFLDNQWIRLATVDPLDATRIQYYVGNGRWERMEGNDERLGQARSSLAWYKGQREHLPLARILGRGAAARSAA